MNGYKMLSSRLLVGIHLFILLVTAIIFVVGLFVGMPEGVSIWIGNAIIFVSYITYRKTGNVSFSGNLLAAAFVATIAPAISKTGGIFSDNMLWLLTAPLLSLLFSSISWSIFWFLVIEILVVNFRFDDSSNAMLDGVFSLNPDDFLLSYLFFFLIALGIVFIFKIGQTAIIRDLQENQAILESRQAELADKNRKLQITEEQLRQSNAELETFAYAASHDLKEPLRMIGMYTGLVRRRLAGTLTEETGEFMAFVTDGVNRMQKMLDDLLEYSRIGRKDGTERPVNLDDTLFLVKNNLHVRITESGAIINSEKLPVLFARPTEMIQLFQNLLGNAIKFRKKDQPPVIEITWVIDRERAVFAVRDNGIGIPFESQEKVFAIFERLNAKTEYEGSGIGLATCKKIVESLGGVIWLRSEPEVGTTFFFSFPKEKLVDEPQSGETKKEAVAV